MRITTTKKFDKKLKKQSVKIQKEFIKRVTFFIQDKYHPFLKTHKLSGKLQDLWSFNLSGDIRIIFDMVEDDVAMLVDTGSHSDLYS